MPIILNGTTGITTPGITNTGPFVFQGVVELTAGTVSAPSLTTTGDTNTGIFFPAADTIAFTEGGTESFRVNSSGNMGIGTTSPTNTAGFSRQLQIEGTTAALTLSGTTGTGKYTLGVPGANAVGLWDNTASAYRWYVDSSGNVGIGTTSPVARLDVFKTSSDTISRTNAVGAFGDYVSLGAGLLLQQTLSSPYGFALQAANAANSVQFPLLLNPSGGNVGIGTASPTAKLTITTATSDATVGFNLRAYTTGADGDRTVSSRYTSSNDGNWANSKYQAWSHIWETNGTEKLRLDSSGNLGLGVTPSASFAGYKTFQIASQGVISSDSTSNGELEINNNAYRAVTTATLTYINSFAATKYAQYRGEHRWFNAASGTAGNAISFTQAMTLDASGNLALGSTSILGSTNRASFTNTTSAKGVLALQNTSTSGYSAIELYDNGGTQQGAMGWGNASVAVTGAQSATYLYSTGAITFLSGGTTERARITSGGNFIVGGTSAVEGGLFVTSFNGAAVPGVVIADTSATATANMLFFHKSGAVRGSIQTTASATAYNTSSDRRLKDNIAPADDAGEVIDAIEVVKHDWKVGGHTRYGMIAQDLHMVAPEAVSVGDADDVEDFKNPWGVDYSKLVPMMMKELQSLRKRVAELESK